VVYVSNNCYVTYILHISFVEIGCKITKKKQNFDA
jgi:hypothetical protein